MKPGFAASRWVGWLAGGAVAGACVLTTAWLALRWVPLPPALLAAPAPTMELVDRHGRPLRAVPGPGGFERRIAFTDVPRPLVDATIAAEDKRFWRHHGVDWLASGRALAGWVRHGRVVSGGSTITQQLIKLAHPRPRTLRTKLIEAAQATRLEQLWDKPRILTEYLNRLDYGNLCVGAAEAARFYFGRPLAELSAPEAAFLAGLPQAPGRLNPVRHFDRARQRQQWVLSQMARTGCLSPAELARHAATPLRLASPRRTFEAPHFVDLLLARSNTPRGAAAPATLRTTLDLEWNRFAEQALRRQIALRQADRLHNGAVVVIENASGAVRVLVGSEDFFAPASGQVNGAWARRSPGSALKPFTYLLALEQGATPASIVADVRAEFPTPTGVFQPVNYNHRCYGPMRYRLALANSLNIAAVKVLDSIGGPDPLQRRLVACGLTTLDRSPEHYGLGLTLGNAEVRLLELVNAYAVLARLGEFQPWRLSDKSEGDPARPGRRTVADPGAAWLVADILSDNDARALVFGRDSDLRFAFPVACKTGTSSDFRDNWALGYTPEFTVGVWVGNFDGSPMARVSGVSGAAPVLHAVVEFLHEQHGTSWYQPPPGIVERLVDPLTGRALAHGDRRGVPEKFLGPCPPAEASAADYDPEGRVRLSSEYRDWATADDNWLAGRVVVEEADLPPALRLVTPRPGSTFFIDPDLPESSRWLRLRAEGSAPLEWSSDTLQLRVERGTPYARLEAGRHRLVARAPQTGESQEIWITIRQL